MLLGLFLLGCAKPEPAEPMLTETEPVTEAATGAPTQMPTEKPTEPIIIAPTEPALLPEPEDDELVRVIDYLPSVREELAYATGENFTGQRAGNR